MTEITNVTEDSFVPISETLPGYTSVSEASTLTEFRRKPLLRTFFRVYKSVQMVEITDISILQKEAASSKPPFRHHAPRTVYRKHGSLLHHLSGADSGDT
jgi:hypothetical protein